MESSSALELALDDLLADLRHARRQGDLGRMALLAYCEVRRWARLADEPTLSTLASQMITAKPFASRAAFLQGVDGMIDALVQLRPKFAASPAVVVSAQRAGR